MQQTIYNPIRSDKTNQTLNTIISRGAGVRRWAGRSWELAGVLTLMGASAAYGIFALAHLGL